MCIYHISWQSDFGFCCELDEECARELAGVPGVLSVQPDENFDSDNKNCGGENLQQSSNSPDSLAANETTNVKTKKLFVTGLSFYTSEKTLRAAFEGFGEIVEVEGIRGSYGPTASNVKLFVFGDLYADTGNTPQLFSNSWKQPYGMTYPGKPSGWFSDGRILTDYIAQFFGITTPVPYEERKSEMKLIQHGMNFAFGGTGVFNTLVPEPKCRNK